MKKWLWTAVGAVCMLGLCACGPVNPVIGDGESSVLVTNDLDGTITSLEVLAGAPEGFETIMPTEDVTTIEKGQTVEVHYEVGSATYDPGTVGSGQTDQTSDQPLAEPTSEVGEAPNAVSVDANGNQTSKNAESGEEALVDEVTGQTDTASTDAKTTTSTTGVESMPITGDAIRVVMGGKTLVFDGLDLPNYKEVSLRTTSDGVNYVDYVDVNDQTGSTKEAATQALAQWQAAQKASADAKQQADAAAAAAVTGAATAEATTDANAANNNTNSSGNNSGGSNAVDPNNQGINGDGLGAEEGGNAYDYDDQGTNGDGAGEGENVYDTNDQGTNGDGDGGEGTVNQNEGNCTDGDAIFNE